MNTNTLPEDLVNFLSSGAKLKYDTTKCEIGAVELKNLHDLKLNNFRMELPRVNKHNNHPEHAPQAKIQCVSLLKHCDGYDAWGMLCWFPSIHQYGTIDVDNGLIYSFGIAISWREICKEPIKWLEYQWASDSLPWDPNLRADLSTSAKNSECALHFLNKPVYHDDDLPLLESVYTDLRARYAQLPTERQFLAKAKLEALENDIRRIYTRKSESIPAKLL